MDQRKKLGPARKNRLEAESSTFGMFEVSCIIDQTTGFLVRKGGNWPSTMRRN